MTIEAEPARPGISGSTRWVLAGTVATKPVQLATNVLLARLLGPAAFGYLNLANAGAMTLSALAGLGLGEAANRFIAENFRRARTTAIGFAALIIWSSLALALGAFAVAWLARDLWAPRVFHGVASDEIVALCLGLGFLNLLFSLALNIFTGMQSFRDVAALSVLQAGVAAALCIPLAYLYGVTGALSGSVAAAAVCLAWAAWRIRRLEPRLLAPPGRLEPGHAGEIFHFSFPSWLAALVANPVLLFVFSYLAAQASGPEELGQFNTANALKMLVALLPGLVGAAIGPAIIEAAGRHGDTRAFDALLRNALYALAFLTLPLTVALLFLSDAVFLIYGPAYPAAHRLFMPLAAGIALGVLSTPFQVAMVAHSRTWWLLVFAMAKSGILLGVALWLVPQSLSMGLAWAFFSAEAVHAVLVTAFSARRGLVPTRARHLFYVFAVLPLVLLAAALMLPAIWRWMLAAPVALAIAFGLIRAHPEVAIWIGGALPSAIGPRMQSWLQAIAGHAPR